MISVGADPEWFLRNDNGKIVSAINKVGGSKSHPRHINTPFERIGFAVQEDNVALEYNIPPVFRGNEWLSYHSYMRSHIENELSSIGLKPAILASHVFDEDELDHPRAWIFGCEPDYDAWQRKINPAPKSSEERLRSAGGHIHIGYPEPNKTKSVQLCRRADLYIGLPLMVVDLDKRRMELYGRPGAMRFKPYGFEYRTPSNLWTISDEMIAWVYSQVLNMSVSMIDPPKEVADIINAMDKDEGRSMMKHYGIESCPL